MKCAVRALVLGEKESDRVTSIRSIFRCPLATYGLAEFLQLVNDLRQTQTSNWAEDAIRVTGGLKFSLL